MAPSIAWTIPRTVSPDWNVTVVRQKADLVGDRSGDQAADPSIAADPAVPGIDALSDADLVAACLQSRPGAFDLVVERHRRTVYQLCYRFVGSHEDASDLSQDVFLRAYRGLRTFRGQSSLGTWLYRIGVNVCLNRVAAKVPRTEAIEEREHVDTKTESPVERVLRGERAVRVRTAVAQLPPKQRATLILRIYHELSHQEIADIVGSSVGAVKANVFHALQNLKKILGEDLV
jgi:RNA polymerase sigma-70 factor (ECF subfamily)